MIRITAIFGVRWVASSYRAVRAVWRNYSALYKHFATASMDTTGSTMERAKFQGLANKLGTVSFLQDLALIIMKDVGTGRAEWVVVPETAGKRLQYSQKLHSS